MPNIVMSDTPTHSKSHIAVQWLAHCLLEGRLYLPVLMGTNPQHCLPFENGIVL